MPGMPARFVKEPPPGSICLLITRRYCVSFGVSISVTVRVAICVTVGMTICEAVEGLLRRLSQVRHFYRARG